MKTATNYTKRYCIFLAPTEC